MIKVDVKIYDGVKYEASSKVAKRVTYEIERFEIIHEADDKDIRANYTDEELDPFDEYLRLYLADGETATFRNSYVDMFRW